jgi:peptide deformylase
MIITDESLLRVKCEDVTLDEVSSLRDKLEYELQRSADMGMPGIGLAAPQIGIPKKMAIVRVPTSNLNINIDLVNCRIASAYDESLFEEEGCLSFPGKIVKTKRYREIHVVDNLVPPFNFIVTGLAAVCCQHELDHTRGILLSDVAIKV